MPVQFAEDAVSVTQTSITLIKNRPKGVNEYDVTIKQSDTVVATVQRKLDVNFVYWCFLTNLSYNIL